jgi:hypothetical protein
MRQARHAFGVLMLVGLWVASSHSAAPPPKPAEPLAAPPLAELRRLRVLLVFDTQSELKDQLALDKQQIRRALVEAIPAPRLELTTLTGRQATREKILAHYRNLRTSADEGLVFFYGGQGATDPKKGHYLRLQNGKKGGELFRSDLREAMEAKKAGLVVILTDCCRTVHVKRGTPPAQTPAEQPAGRAVSLRPLINCLFFQARGTVDIASASLGSTAWGDDETGSIFVRVLCRLLRENLRKLDTNHDGFVSWKEFFEALQPDVEHVCKKWSKALAERGVKIGAKHQKPTAFAVSYYPVAGRAERCYAVISMTNRAKNPLKYRYRWSDTVEWQSATIEPGKQGYHAKFCPSDMVKRPLFEIQVERAPRPSTLTPAYWSGTGEPGFEQGKLFTWTPKSKRK